MINADGRIRLSGFATNVITPKAKEIVHNIIDDQSLTDSEKAKHLVKKEFEPYEMRKIAQTANDVVDDDDIEWTQAGDMWQLGMTL